MAKNSRRRKKLQPAVMNFSFTAAGTGTNYIDLSRAASILNRRSYAQGLNWSVAGFTITVTGTTTAPGSVTICKVPTTYVAYNAWVKSKAMWDQMNDQVLDDQPGLEGRWADFKVYLDSAMQQATVQNAITPTDGQILVPVDCMYNLPENNGSEWRYSTIQVPTDGGAAAPTEYGLHFVGPTITAAGSESAGLITGYAKSRARPVNTGDPSVPDTGGWMQDLFDLADNLEEIRDDIAGDNDRPPYPVGNTASSLEYYPGGSLNLPSTEVVGYGVFSTGGTTAVTAQRFVKGGMFPCGLIEIKGNLPGITFYDVIVHMVPGHHRGYLAQKMEDV